MTKHLHIGKKNDDTDYGSWTKDGYFKGGSHVTFLSEETDDKTKIQYYPKLEYGPDETVLAVAGGAYEFSMDVRGGDVEIDWGDNVIDTVVDEGGG